MFLSSFSSSALLCGQEPCRVYIIIYFIVCDNQPTKTSALYLFMYAYLYLSLCTNNMEFASKISEIIAFPNI